MSPSALGETFSCEAVAGRLSDCLDGDLFPEVLDAVELHLAGCAACAELARETIRSVLALRPFEPWAHVAGASR